MGIIENMSYYQCPKCGHSEHIFGQDGAKRIGEELNMELLGQVSATSTALYCTCMRFDGGSASTASAECLPLDLLVFCFTFARVVSGMCQSRMSRMENVCSPCTFRMHANEQRMATEASVPRKVPLEIGIRETSDAGTPIVASHPDSSVARVYCSIADRVRHKLRLVEPQSGPRRAHQNPP